MKRSLFLNKTKKNDIHIYTYILIYHCIYIYVYIKACVFCYYTPQYTTIAKLTENTIYSLFNELL